MLVAVKGHPTSEQESRDTNGAETASNNNLAIWLEVFVDVRPDVSRSNSDRLLA